MVHAGRPPLTAVKYGVNCFFNEEKMRLVKQPQSRVEPDKAFLADVQALRRDEEEQHPAEGVLRTFTLQTVPQVQAVARFASEEEVGHLLQLAETCGPADAAGSGQERFFAAGTAPVRVLEPAESDVVAALEARLAAVARFPLEHLGRMRVVRCGSAYGLCNRSCGQRAALVCLAARDEVFFPHLNMRLLLRRGDMISWPNAWWSEPISDAPDARTRIVEDLRTTRYHLLSDGTREPPLALDASFHDAPVKFRVQAATEG
mmetsp:Transcript_109546/g.320628  ORF Transcript_109546/g.320628 Transcript_109546/m.320628 type:complete len:260 (+) Transcript_109546:3-782(+)